MAVVSFPSPWSEPVGSVTIPDADERVQALDITSSWITEAPAGSGKTGLLIQRYLKLLAIVDEPEEVLALTFTQKATSEMRERVLHALRCAGQELPASAGDFDRLTDLLAQGALRRDAEQEWHLLDRPRRLNIRTIDSLCSEIARSVPLLSGGVGFARPVRDAEPLYRRAAHNVMMQFGGPDAALNQAVQTVLLHRDGDLMFCERVLAEMLGTREQWGRLVPLGAAELEEAFLDGEVLPRLNAALERTLCMELTRLHRCFPETELARIAELAQQFAYAEGYNGARNPFSPCATAPGAPGTDAQHRDHWIVLASLLLNKVGQWRKSFLANHTGASVSKALQDEMKELVLTLESDELRDLLHAVRNLPEATYPAEQWVVAKSLFRLLQRALIELQLIFATEEICDFSAVALAARNALLHSSEEAPAILRFELRHLLVDEMQDTSSSQYELLQELTSGWDGKSQTVFLVGDPKQSIYLFRQARVELFQRCMKNGRLGSVPLCPLSLSSNFRSGSHIVEEFSETFRSIFPADAIDADDVTYSAAHAVRPAARGEGILWHANLLPFETETGDRIRQRQRGTRTEAREIASLIAAWRAEHGTCKIAVLTRARSHVSEIAKALAASGIPYRAVDMEALAERREVLDILAITRALLNPADRTAWLALLHAPWCAAGLVDLFKLAAGDQSAKKNEALRTHLRDRSQSLMEPVRGRVLRTLDVMDAALLHCGAESLSNRVERTWRSLGGDVCTDTLGRANVRQFLRVLDEMESEGEPVDVHSLDRRLERLFAEPGQAADAIDVMTIHKAKGLEWDMVLVPGMHRVGARDRYALLDWLELPTEDRDGSRDVLLAPVPSKSGVPGTLNTYIRTTRQNRARAELKRVFYVAATRARTSLHLFAWPEATKSGNSRRS